MALAGSFVTLYHEDMPAEDQGRRPACRTHVSWIPPQRAGT
jgi:hypothetical protein